MIYIEDKLRYNDRIPFQIINKNFKKNEHIFKKCENCILAEKNRIGKAFEDKKSMRLMLVNQMLFSTMTRSAVALCYLSSLWRI